MKFLVLKGLPGSGKSTEAKRLCDSGQYVRINRDTVREMLLSPRDDGKKAFDPSIESIVTEICQNAAKVVMAVGKKHIVLDECNLNPKYLKMWEKFANDYGYKYEVRGMGVDITECIRRDALRSPRVGARVIKNMAIRNDMLEGYDVFPKVPFEHKVVLCDVDGTLADITHRLHWVRGDGRKDWKQFFENMDKDTLRIDTYNILKSFEDDGCIVVLVTARPAEYLIDTVDFMNDNGVDFDYMIMRKNGDYRRDDIVKQEILDKWFPDKSIIDAVIDDRPQVIRMWEKNGLNVIDVGKGIDF